MEKPFFSDFVVLRDSPFFLNVFDRGLFAAMYVVQVLMNDRVLAKQI
ncbi:hypothetical protein [Algoriphagus sediminis]|nr:hypothetical protein [Algoriphagus sediminis]